MGSSTLKPYGASPSVEPKRTKTFFPTLATDSPQGWSSRASGRPNAKVRRASASSFIGATMRRSAEHALLLRQLDPRLPRLLGDHRCDRMDGSCNHVEHLALDLEDAVDHEQRVAVQDRPMRGVDLRPDRDVDHS